jgi:hypothetical protein
LIDSEPLHQISGLIPADHLSQVAAIGGARGLSAGVRDTIAAGLLALRGDAAMLAPISELHQLADKLATITGRTTPSGAIWAPTEEALPPVEMLDPDGAVIVTPQAVGLLAGAAALVLDTEAGAIIVRGDGGELQQPLELPDLAALAAMLGAGLQALSRGPGVVQLPCGLTAERTGTSAFRIAFQGVGPTTEPDVAFMFAAEVAALFARRVTSTLRTRQQLEETLHQQEVSHG